MPANTDVWVARKPMKVGSVSYNPGDTVAEASWFRLLRVLVHAGWLEKVQTATTESFGPKQRVPTAAPKQWGRHVYYRYDSNQVHGRGKNKVPPH